MTTKLQQVIARSKVATLDDKLGKIARQALEDKFGDKKKTRRSPSRRGPQPDGFVTGRRNAPILNLREAEAVARRLATEYTYRLTP